MSVEASIVRHYARGSLASTLLDALAAAGKDLEHLAPGDLAPVEMICRVR